MVSFAEQVLDADADGVIVVARGGELCYSNAQAKVLIAEGVPLRVTSRRLVAADPELAQVFIRAVDQACNGRGGAVLSAEGGRFRIAVAHLPYNPPPPPGVGAFACVRVRDEAARLDRALTAASAAYGFTQAEAALADSLLRGLSPADHAVQRAVSMPTVRSQLRGLLAKAAVARQGELIAALWRFV